MKTPPAKKLHEEIIEAYIFLREKNQRIPSETLDFIKDAAIEKLEEIDKQCLQMFDYGCNHKWLSIGHQMNGHQECEKCGKTKPF